MDNDLNTDDIELDTTDTEETDYKALYEETQTKYEKADANFKKMAQRYNSIKDNSGNDVDVNSLIDSKIKDVEFYSSNPVAKEFKNEIQDIQSRYDGMTSDDAFNLWKATNKPELLQPKKGEGVDGIEDSGRGTITDADLLKMSDEDFMKNFRP